MEEKKISNKRRLNENILEIKAETPVIDKETGKAVPGIVKRAFRFSCPYRTGDDRIAYVAKCWGRNFFDAGFSKGPMTEELAVHHAQTYMKYAANRGKIVATKVNCRIYKQPHPALDRGDPLNALEVRGFLYNRAD
ncbi:hypothetical protein A3K73_00035 [Candidatus Pacearchaeota archaeon RBG_13_36_9]|nr:MAG: hypothetical protein A3K73_00035 [Candidatus Pacearchaeota archaeon RBG_13_36_9]HJX50930.1 hypothetical protein [Candidatus Nanoarchaeia archaeon]